MNTSDIGMVGLGTMGKNLALNFARNGVSVSVINKENDVTERFLIENPHIRNIQGFKDIADFVASLSIPRVVVLLVTAGNPVDEVINTLIPYLRKGDIIIDSGNSHYKDTERRYSYLKEKELLFLGMGISGGAEGALKGPALMPGGDYNAYKEVEEKLKMIAAKSKYGPCVDYMGERSAGHFVKMVHNGIEYAIIGVISEVYHLMRDVFLLHPFEISSIFEEWNNSVCDSFLLRTAIAVLNEKDESTKSHYIDVILDVAEQKGTGLWFSQTALELNIPALTITASVNSRIVSVFRELRKEVSKKSEKIYTKEKGFKLTQELIDQLKDAFLFVNYMAFTEGLWLLIKASYDFEYNVQLKNVLRVWRNGSILESSFLDTLFSLDLDGKECLLESLDVLKNVQEFYVNTIQVSNIAKRYGIPTPVIDSAINLYLSVTTATLPANLVQGIRDWFGYHGFYRIDVPGKIFHFEKYKK
ncbi:NADP-dependent phosphogluconate dehydrogenase [Fervidobacterium sp.]